MLLLMFAVHKNNKCLLSGVSLGLTWVILDRNLRFHKDGVAVARIKEFSMLKNQHAKLLCQS